MLQVEWLHEYTSDVRVATPEDMPDAVVADVLNSGKPVARGYGSRVKATPVQFHFHYGSENWVAGERSSLLNLIITCMFSSQQASPR